MDGATNMNTSNAPPAITAGETKKLKKSITKDAAAAEKHVTQVGKSLRSAEKDESKAEKVSPLTVVTPPFPSWRALRTAGADVVVVEQAAHKAQRARDKAVQEEHKTAQVLSEAQHGHDLAVAGENKAVNDLSVRV